MRGRWKDSRNSISLSGICFQDAHSSSCQDIDEDSHRQRCVFAHLHPCYLAIHPSPINGELANHTGNLLLSKAHVHESLTVRRGEVICRSEERTWRSFCLVPLQATKR